MAEKEKPIKLKKAMKNLKKSFTEAESEFEKFMEGNDSAGTRLRKNLMDLQKMTKIGRDGVMVIRNKRKEKKTKK